MIRNHLPFLLVLFFLNSFSQNQSYSSFDIDKSLLKDSNAVVRLSSTIITISAYNKMVEENRRIVTVLNSKGEHHLDAYAFYDLTTKIKKLEAIIYDKNGNEIKKIRKNDFKDVSAVNGGTMYSDYRVKYLEYNALTYPYTVEFVSEVESTTTAFISSWLPLEDYRVSTELSQYKVINTSGVQLKTKKTNFKDYDIKEISRLSFEGKNLKAITPEVYSLGFKNLVPYMRLSLEEFDMKGVKGSNKSWNDFGKWMNDKLINDTRVLPQNVIDEVLSLIPDNASDVEKMKIVYKYMQDRTRYISVQVGIGGWRPIVAEEVDRLGYGDCKGLSNYTKALLEAVGIPAHYAVIYGGQTIKSFDKEFSTTEGNHAILAVPYQDNYIWLECTNQINPFGYIANFTDDRDALLITPNGGQIVHTKIYETSDNLTRITANVELSTDGHIKADVEIFTKGAPYGYHSSIEGKNLKDQKLTYKEDYWEDINRLKIESIELVNNKEDIHFTESVKLNASKYAKVTGGRLLFEPNFFNKLTYVPPKNDNRLSEIKIDRGYTDKDEYILKIPENTTVEALPNPINITNDFGSYFFQVIQKDDSSIYIKRELIFNKGLFEASRYNEYRDFRKSIAKADNSKMVLKLN